MNKTLNSVKLQITTNYNGIEISLEVYNKDKIFLNDSDGNQLAVLSLKELQGMYETTNKALETFKDELLED